MERSWELFLTRAQAFRARPGCPEDLIDEDVDDTGF